MEQLATKSSNTNQYIDPEEFRNMMAVHWQKELGNVISDKLAYIWQQLAVEFMKQIFYFDDPYEMTNLIDSAGHAATRDRLHDVLVAEMARTRDPMWNVWWEDRPWRPAEHFYLRPGRSTPRPKGFSFQRP